MDIAEDRDVIETTPCKKVIKTIIGTHGLKEKESTAASSAPYTQTNLPFVFFEIKEILDFSSKKFPSVGNIKTVGLYREESNSFVLEKPESNPSTKLLLDIKLLESFPSIGDSIELFGFVELRTLEHKEVPVFIARFWSPLDGNLVEYIRVLKLLKAEFIPMGCQKFVNVDSFDNSMISVSQNDIDFEDLDFEHFKDLDFKHFKDLDDTFDKILAKFELN